MHRRNQRPACLGTSVPLVSRYLKLLESTVGGLRLSVDKILIRINGNYMQFEGYIANGYVINPVSMSAEYIKANERIIGLNHTQRSGDIVLIMKDATSGDALDRYTTGVACKSWHGSLNPSDSLIPFILSYPGGNKIEIDTILKKDTVCKDDYRECRKNWKLPDIVQEIISEQHN